jgi:hypothetical protein
MLEPLGDLPEGVIGFRAVGEIHADDYRDVLQPALQQVLDRGENVRIVLEFPGFDGISAGATWEDLKMGVEHLTRWERVALVTDVEWMIHLTGLFGWMMPGELRHFPLSERDDAIAWAASG